MSRRGTINPMHRMNSNFTRSQKQSLKKDGQYKNRHIFKLEKIFSDMVNDGYAESVANLYDDIKTTENQLRLEHPTMSQKKLAAKTFKVFKEEFEGSSPTSRNSNSSGTRSRRSNSSRTRSSRSSSGTRRRRSSSGTRRSRSRSSRSLRASDL
jgi:hypothetical protein